MNHHHYPLLPFTLIAHRGDSAHAPENTLAAFQRALQIGVDFIELDIHLSKDGVPVVIHDDTLERTTNGNNKSQISALSFQELKQSDVGRWFGENYRGESIPSLEQVLMMVLGSCGLMIEVKENNESPKKSASAVVDIIKKCHSSSSHQVIVGSFSHQIIQEIHLLDPHRAIMGIVEEHSSLEAFLKMGIHHIAIDYQILDQSLIQRLCNQNIIIWTYTIDEIEIARTFVDHGVQGIISNDPRTIKQLSSSNT